MEVILVRHGATKSNIEAGAYSGWVDLELAESGIAQAQMAAERLRSAPVSRVVCSDLRRAIRTGEIIAEPHGLQPEIAPAWRELNYGEWDGLTVAQVDQRWPGARKRLSEDPDFRLPGGETLAELLARLLPALSALQDGAGPEEAVVVVSHKAAIRVLLCHLLGLPINRYKQIEQENCAINRLRPTSSRRAGVPPAIPALVGETPAPRESVRDGSFVVTGVNLTDHLLSPTEL